MVDSRRRGGPGETLQAAVVREILEETQVAVEPVALVKVLDRIFRDKEGRVTYHYVLVDFLCRLMAAKLNRGRTPRRPASFRFRGWLR